MPGIDDFRKLSDSVVTGGNDMRASLVDAVEAAREMDKILDAVTRQQAKSLKVANSYRVAIKKTADKMDVLKKSASTVRDSTKDIAGAFDAAKRPLKDLKDAIGEVTEGLNALSKVDLSFKGLSSASTDMDAMVKATVAMTKVQKTSVALTGRQAKATKNLANQMFDVREYSKGLTRNFKAFNAQLKGSGRIGKSLQSAFDGLDITGNVSVNFDQSAMGKVRDAFVELKDEMEHGLDVSLEIDTSEMRKVQGQIADFHEELTKALSAEIHIDDSGLRKLRMDLANLGSEIDVSAGGKASGGGGGTASDAKVLREIATNTAGAFEYFNSASKDRGWRKQVKRQIGIEDESMDIAKKAEKAQRESSVSDVGNSAEKKETAIDKGILKEQKRQSKIAAAELAYMAKPIKVPTLKLPKGIAGASGAKSDNNQKLSAGILEEIGRVEKDSRSTAKDIGTITKEATSKGSLYTADEELKKTLISQIGALRRSLSTQSKGPQTAKKVAKQIDLTASVREIEKLVDSLEDFTQEEQLLLKALVSPAGGKPGATPTEAVKLTKPKAAVDFKDTKKEAKKMASISLIPRVWDSQVKDINKKLSILGITLKTAGSYSERFKAGKGITELRVELQKFKSFEEIIGMLDEVQLKFLKGAKSAEQLEERLLGLVREVPALNEVLQGQAEAARMAADSNSDMEASINEVYSVQGQLNKRLKTGEEEAKNFAGGAKFTGLTLTGAALAAGFLLNKIGELIGGFKDAAINLAKYNIETEALAKRNYDMVPTGQAFKQIRNELKLTREEAKEFFEVLYTGVASGLASVRGLVDTAAKLRAAFGGDQTKRLKEYVDILKEIPSIDTDLSFTATADDKAAALFSLAEKGKLGTVIELRAAGILGGRGRQTASKEDIDLLNNAQSTEKAIQDMKDGMLKKFFPTWGPQFSAIAENTSKILAAVLGGFAVLGGINYLTGGAMSTLLKPLIGAFTGGGAAKIATKVASAALSKAPKAAVGAVPPVLTGAAGAAPETAAAGALAEVAPAATETATAMTKMATVVKGASAGLWKFAKSAAGVTAIAGAAFTLAGMGADILAESFDKAGDKTSASASRLAAGFLSFAGTVAGMASLGATIGSLGGPIGTAGGAVIGAVIGAAQSFEGMGKEAQFLGKTFQDTSKYSKGMALFGKIMEIQGKGLEISGKGINWVFKMTGAVVRGLGEEAVIGAKWLGNLAVAAKDWAIFSNAELAKRKDAQAELDKFSASMKGVSDVNDVLKMRMDKRDVAQSKAWGSFGAIMQRMNSEVNNAKKELFEFRKNLAGVQLGNLAEIGGSAEQFNRALVSMTTSVRGRFDMQMKAYEKARQDILKNGNLDATTRRMALDKMHKAEADATKEFVEGMKSAIEALYKAPGMIQAGLKAKIAEAKFDMKLENKTFTVEEMGEKFKESVEASNKSYEETVKAGEAAVTVAAQAQLDLAQKTKNMQLEAAKGISEEFAKAGDVLVKKVDAVEFDIANMKNVPADFTKKIMESQVGGAAPGKVTMKADAFASLPEDVQKALGETKKVIVEDVTANADTLKSRIANNEKSLKGMWEAFDQLNANLPTDDLSGISANLARLSKREAQYNKAVEDSQKSMKKMEDKGVDITDESYKKEKTKVEENQKALSEVAEQRAKLTVELDKYKADVVNQLNIERATKKEAELSVAEQDKVGDAIKEVQVAMAKGPEEFAAAVERLKAVPGLDATKVIKSLNKYGVQMSEASSMSKNIDKTMKENENAQRIIADTTENQNLLFETESKRLEANIASKTKILSQIRKMAQLESTTLNDRKRELEIIRNQSDAAGLTGKSMENYTQTIEKQGEVFDEQQKMFDKLSKTVGEMIAPLTKKLELAEEEAKKGGIAGEKAKEEVASLTMKIKAHRDGLKEQQKAILDAGATMVNTAMSFQAAMDQLSKDVSFREFSAKIDMSGAEMELAQYSDDWQAINKKGFETAVEYGKKRLTMEKATLAKALEDNLAAINKYYDEAIPKGQATEAQRTAAIEATMATNKKDASQKEADYKKLVVDRAKQSAQYATDVVDIQQQVVEAQAQFLTEANGSWQEILGLQAQSVGFEKEKYLIAKKLADDMEAQGIRGRDLEMAQGAARLAEVKYQQKALGAQKSAYEGMMGMAFGAIRSAHGLRMQTDSAVMKMGREKTLIKTRSGQFRGAKPGEKVQTIDQRAITNQLEAAFGNIGGKKKDSVLTRSLDDIMKNRAERGTPETMLDVALKNADTTETMAKATDAGSKAQVNMDQNSSTVGSLYVHDVPCESLLKKLCDYSARMMTALENMKGGTTAGTETTDNSSIVDAIGEVTTMMDGIGSDLLGALNSINFSIYSTNNSKTVDELLASTNKNNEYFTSATSGRGWRKQDTRKGNQDKKSDETAKDDSSKQQGQSDKNTKTVTEGAADNTKTIVGALKDAQDKKGDGKGGTDKKGKSLEEQLIMARKEYAVAYNSFKQLKDSGKTGPELVKAADNAAAALQKMLGVQDSMMAAEWKNPFVGGGGDPMEGIESILRGEVSPSLKAQAQELADVKNASTKDSDKSTKMIEMGAKTSATIKVMAVEIKDAKKKAQDASEKARKAMMDISESEMKQAYEVYQAELAKSKNVEQANKAAVEYLKKIHGATNKVAANTSKKDKSEAAPVTLLPGHAGEAVQRAVELSAKRAGELRAEVRANRQMEEKRLKDLGETSKTTMVNGKKVVAIQSKYGKMTVGPRKPTPVSTAPVPDKKAVEEARKVEDDAIVMLARQTSDKASSDAKKADEEQTKRIKKEVDDSLEAGVKAMDAKKALPPKSDSDRLLADIRNATEGLDDKAGGNTLHVKDKEARQSLKGLSRSVKGKGGKSGKGGGSKMGDMPDHLMDVSGIKAAFMAKKSKHAAFKEPKTGIEGKAGEAIARATEQSAQRLSDMKKEYASSSAKAAQHLKDIGETSETTVVDGQKVFRLQSKQYGTMSVGAKATLAKERRASGRFSQAEIAKSNDEAAKLAQETLDTDTDFHSFMKRKAHEEEGNRIQGELTKVREEIAAGEADKKKREEDMAAYQKKKKQNDFRYNVTKMEPESIASAIADKDLKVALDLPTGPTLDGEPMTQSGPTLLDDSINKSLDDVDKSTQENYKVQPDPTLADTANSAIAQGKTPNSFYTHDVPVEQAIIGLGKTLETVFQRSAGGLETAPGMTASGFAGMGGDAGAPGGGSIKVTGEITVKFDNEMFKQQVVQVMGNAIRNGDIRKPLVQQGFTNQISQ